MTAGALSPLRDKDCFRFPLQPPQEPAFPSILGCTLVAPPLALLQFLIGDFRWSAGTLQQAER